MNCEGNFYFFFSERIVYGVEGGMFCFLKIIGIFLVFYFFIRLEVVSRLLVFYFFRVFRLLCLGFVIKIVFLYEKNLEKM